MPRLHFPVACLLTLLQARAAAGMLNDTIPSPTPDSVSHATMPGVTATSSDPSEVNTTKSRASVPGEAGPAVEPKVSLHCLADGRVMVSCEPGRHRATSFHWTLDGKVLDETNATFGYNNSTVTFAKSMSGELVCTINGHFGNIKMASIKPGCAGAEENDYICENDWFRYSIILAATGGGSLLLSVVILTITCCCGRRRLRHISLDHEEIELGEKEAAVQVVGAVEETALIANKAAMKVAPEQDGVKFPTPPDMESVVAEGAATGTSKEWRDNSTSGSDLNRCESPADKTMENESEGIQGN